jgi:hypothetical protein
MTKTHTGFCGILGCTNPVDWDVGPGLCHGDYEAFKSYTAYAPGDPSFGNEASIERWLEGQRLEVSHDN